MVSGKRGPAALLFAIRYWLMKTVTRRSFINLVGKAGGYTAVYNTMAAMGLLPVPAYAGPPQLAP